jgi:hypothetical protein
MPWCWFKYKMLPSVWFSESNFNSKSVLIFKFEYLLYSYNKLYGADIFEKLIFTQLAKKFYTFYGIWRFITMFTRSHHWSLSWVVIYLYSWKNGAFDLWGFNTCPPLIKQLSQWSTVKLIFVLRNGIALQNILFQNIYMSISCLAQMPGNSCLACSTRLGNKMVNTSKLSGNYMYHVLQQPITLHFAHRMYLWVLYDCQSKQWLFL